jgi:hypothetical protein
LTNKCFDKYGNEIYCQNKRIYLRLLGENRTRCLGVVDGDTFRTQRKVSLHTMRNQNDIGFNYSLIRYGRFNYVEVELSDGKTLKTTRENIFKNGECKHFGNNELQIFLEPTKFNSQEQFNLQEKKHATTSCKRAIREPTIEPCRST